MDNIKNMTLRDMQWALKSTSYSDALAPQCREASKHMELLLNTFIMYSAVDIRDALASQMYSHVMLMMNELDAYREGKDYSLYFREAPEITTKLRQCITESYSHCFTVKTKKVEALTRRLEFINTIAREGIQITEGVSV
jgi:hypothetical protein